MQAFEAHVVTAAVRTALSTSRVSAVTAPRILIFRPHGRLLSATVTASCSSLLSLLGLAALSFAVLRRRGGHALLGFVVAGFLVALANEARMAASLALGLEYGKFWLVAFHDWAGTLWNFAATLGGFLVMVYLSLPSAERAEQNATGRHTAHRPSSWARPGLGYQADGEEEQKQARRTLAGLFYRRILPKPIARRMARHREAGRIDYRVGYMDPAQRVDAVRALVADGLAVHTASLLAVASYDEDPGVLDALAAAVASRQWEPVVTEKVAAIRLWARARLQCRPGAGQPGSSSAAASHGAAREEAGEAAPAPVTLEAVSIDVIQEEAPELGSLLAGAETSATSSPQVTAPPAEDVPARHEVVAEAPVLAELYDLPMTRAEVPGHRASRPTGDPEPGSADDAVARTGGMGASTSTAGTPDVSVLTAEVPVSPPDESIDAPEARLRDILGTFDEVAIARMAEHGTVAPMPNVLVTGAGGPAGIAVIRRLSALGHPVIAVDADPGATGLRLAARHAVVPLAEDPSFPAALLAVVAQHRPAALICTVAEELPGITDIAEQLAVLGCATSLPSKEAVERCLDKARFASLLAGRRMPHPPTGMFADAATSIPGPWIVKPRRGRGSRGVLALDTAEEVAAVMRSGADLIVQTRLTGHEFTADVLISNDGRPLACVPRWRSETKDGISVKGVTFASAPVTDAVLRTVAALELTGPSCVQGFVGFDGDVRIVEVNPRFSGGLPLTLAAGADVVATYLAEILVPSVRVAPLTFRPGVHMARYLAEVYTDAHGSEVGDPCLVRP